MCCFWTQQTLTALYLPNSKECYRKISQAQRLSNIRLGVCYFYKEIKNHK